MSGHIERAFETTIETGLTSSRGYGTRSPSACDEALALLPADVTGFRKASQPAEWQALEALLGPKTAATVLDGLSKELVREGTPNEAGIVSTIAAHPSIGARPARCIH